MCTQLAFLQIGLLPGKIPNRQMVIADYGSADGSTSLEFLHQLIGNDSSFLVSQITDAN